MTSTTASETSTTKDEHLRLSGLIKGVHSNLRRKFQECMLFHFLLNDVYILPSINSF